MSTALETLPQTVCNNELQNAPIFGGYDYAMACRFMVDSLKAHSSLSWPEAVTAVAAGATTYHEASAIAKANAEVATPVEPQAVAAVASAAVTPDVRADSPSVPPRRIPLRKGETFGNLFRDDVEDLWRAEDSLHTKFWLQSQSVLLRGHKVLRPGEELVAISHDLTYGLTSEGRPLSL